MKKTIKSLEEEIQRVRQDLDSYRSKYYKADGELKEIERQEMFNLDESRKALIEQDKNLLEIIRWLINKETANSPFMPEKTQRDERGRF